MAEAKIVLASHNKGKLKELREILRGHIDGLDVDTQVVDAASVNAPDVPETGVTFAENSLLKARAVARATGLIAIADDSGLSVDVLGGAPGIFSARWAGYDPILRPVELNGENALYEGKYAGQSCAQIPAEIKNSISHRARAFEALIPQIAAALA